MELADDADDDDDVDDEDDDDDELDADELAEELRDLVRSRLCRCAPGLR